MSDIDEATDSKLYWKWRGGITWSQQFYSKHRSHGYGDSACGWIRLDFVKHEMVYCAYERIEMPSWWSPA